MRLAGWVARVNRVTLAVLITAQASCGDTKRNRAPAANPQEVRVPEQTKDMVEPPPARDEREQGCTTSDPLRCFDAARQLSEGIGGPRNEARARAMWAIGCDADQARSADGGLARAGNCFNLGLVWDQGLGVRANPQKACTLFEKACADGLPDGCFRLGSCQELGIGGAKDATKARASHKKACDAAHGQSCFLLGALWYDGAGGPRDVNKAFVLFRKACDAGDPGSCDVVAGALARGEELPKDVAEAKRLYEKACAGGIRESCQSLDALRGQRPD